MKASDPTIDNEEVLELRRQVSTLGDEVTRLQRQLNDVMARLGDAEHAEAASHEPISPDMLVIIAAAISSFLGKKIRIRSAKMLQSPYEIVNPWSQQGRVSVQASHSLRWEH